MEKRLVLHELRENPAIADEPADRRRSIEEHSVASSEPIPEVHLAGSRFTFQELSEKSNIR